MLFLERLGQAIGPHLRYAGFAKPFDVIFDLAVFEVL